MGWIASYSSMNPVQEAVIKRARVLPFGSIQECRVQAALGLIDYMLFSVHLEIPYKFNAPHLQYQQDYLVHIYGDHWSFPGVLHQFAGKIASRYKVERHNVQVKFTFHMIEFVNNEPVINVHIDNTYCISSYVKHEKFVYREYKWIPLH